MSEDAWFARWCESEKPCRYCRKLFIGPVCECERQLAADIRARAYRSGKP
jgi:hypothetical protein